MKYTHAHGDILTPVTEGDLKGLAVLTVEDIENLSAWFKANPDHLDAEDWNAALLARNEWRRQAHAD